MLQLGNESVKKVYDKTCYYYVIHITIYIW